jgi:hypothetical protein
LRGDGSGCDSFNLGNSRAVGLDHDPSRQNHCLPKSRAYSCELNYPEDCTALNGRGIAAVANDPIGVLVLFPLAR